MRWGASDGDAASLRSIRGFVRVREVGPCDGNDLIVLGRVLVCQYVWSMSVCWSSFGWLCFDGAGEGEAEVRTRGMRTRISERGRKMKRKWAVH